MPNSEVTLNSLHAAGSQRHPEPILCGALPNPRSEGKVPAISWEEGGEGGAHVTGNSSLQLAKRCDVKL